MLTNNLLPCPYCGSNNIHVVRWQPDRYHIECKGCEAQTSREFSLTLAVEKWNTRRCSILDETNNSPTCLQIIPTPDLVRELCSREGVCVESVEGWFMDKKPEKYTIEIDRGHGFIHSSGTQDGPCRIIVVRGK